VQVTPCPTAPPVLNGFLPRREYGTSVFDQRPFVEPVEVGQGVRAAFHAGRRQPTSTPMAGAMVCRARIWTSGLPMIFWQWRQTPLAPVYALWK